MNQVSDIAKTESLAKREYPPIDPIIAWKRRGDNQVCVYLNRFEDSGVRLSARTCFPPIDEAGNQLPLVGTRRGITITRDEFEDLACMIDEIRRLFDEAIANAPPPKPRKRAKPVRVVVELD